uniref:Uncharacterized protein n=1 Tax=Arundo donax TaxID=35708 RepID=A0A0A8ZPM6_ARUDO
MNFSCPCAFDYGFMVPKESLYSCFAHTCVP